MFLESVAQVIISFLAQLMGLDINNADQKVAEETRNEIFYEVPFTSQAPSGQWDVTMYQEACEEASALMAISYLRGMELSEEIANKKIADMVEWEKENFGEFRDTSGKDTAEFIKNYFDYENVRYEENIDTDDIIEELEEGNLVIPPLFGKALKNPYFTEGGPDNHMLVVIGYDYETQEFITNDPGTQFGENYRYEKQLFEDALRDYPTGYHEDNLQVNKVMIVVEN